MADSLTHAANPRADIFASIVAVVDAENTNVSEYVRSLQLCMAAKYANYEILLVDNGLANDELIALRRTIETVPCVRVLLLSRKFARDNAIFAGLEAAIGDFVVVTTPNADPIDVLPQIIDTLKIGSADVVQGISTDPATGFGFHERGRGLFYWYNRKYLGIDIPREATYLTGLTRRAVNTLTATRRSHRYLRHLIRHVGHTIIDFPYRPNPQLRKRSIRSGYFEAVEMISSYSTHPLRVITVLGAVTASFNLLYALYVIGVGFFNRDVVEGWTTTSLQLSMMFFAISTMLAVQAEYLGRILTETRREPSYIVIEELESDTLIADAQRRNVTE